MEPKTRFFRVCFAFSLALGSCTFWSCNQSGAPNSMGQQSPGIIAPSANYHADWSNQPAFIQNAIAVQGRHGADLLHISGVIGHGVGVDDSDHTKAVILVFTDHDGAVGIPASLEGLKTRIEMVGNVMAFGKGYTGKYRSPLSAGVSCGDDDECAAGSIGAMVTTSRLTSSGTYTGTYEPSDGEINVYSNSYSATTEHFMLSCNHVFADENGATSADQQDQPGRYDNNCDQGNGVGKLYAWNWIDESKTADNYYDVAIAECNPSLSGGWTGEMISGYTPSNTVVAPSLGTAVKKTGRTSGVTTGTIDGINVTITVSYTNFIAQFVDQIYVKGEFIKAGDSGSMMVTSSGNNPVGLDFAGGGGSFANRMDHIAHDFGLSFVQSGF